MSRDYEGYVPAERRPLEGSVVAPHRGPMIMVLDILSLFVAPIILGPMAWIMGRSDLKEMDLGRMDRAGRDNTNTGVVCGMISTILWGGGTLAVMLLFCMCLGVPAMMGTMGAASAPPTKTQIQATPAWDLGKTKELPVPTERLAPGAMRNQDPIICPHCQTKLQCDDLFDREEYFRCANCGKVFQRK
jgi:hypothetical protein